jgi:hypothetical protein
MPLRPWIGREPVEVHNTERSQIDVTLDRKSAEEPIPFNTVVWMGPNVNQSWYIESIIHEVQADATVGTRIIWAYIRDRDGDMARHQVVTAAASASSYCIMAPGCSAGTITPGPTINVCPPFVTQLDYPCRIGILFTGIDGAADVRHFYAFVREVSKL